MKNRLPMIKPLVFACAIGLAACSGGGTETTAPITVTGTAEAPGGIIAQFEENKSYLVAAVEYVFPGAIAGITGLLPVTGATVQLIRIDDNGDQVGDVLAQTVTTISGDYSLALPTGVSLAGNLVVRITGNGGASMSAMVVDQAVDINPISQFVLDKFVDDTNLVLADLALNEVVALSGKVDEFDLTATSDLSTMLARLEAEVGQFVDNEIAVIEAVPDDGTAVAAAAGKWHTVEMGLGLHDADNINYGTFAMDLLSEELIFSDSGITDLNLTITTGPILVDTFTNFSVDDTAQVNMYHEIDIGSGGESFPGMIDANGNISLSFGFEEDLQTVDTLIDTDGPDYGWRYPPSSEFLQPVAGGNIYVTVFNDAGVRYETIDTNADGVKDAIDPAKRDGDEAAFNLSLIMKEGSNMSTASLNGDFGGVFFNINLDTAPVAEFDSTVGVINLDGTGNATRAKDAFHVQTITRTPATPPAVNLLHPAPSTEPASPDGFSYTVSATGQVTFILDPGVDELEGYASNDGSVMAFIDDESTGDPVSNVNNEMLVFVKLGTVADTEMAGATYKLYTLALNASEDGSSEVFSIGNGLATFNDDASMVIITGVDRGVMRSSDVAQIEPVTADVINEEFKIDSFISGEVTMSSTNTDTFGTETTTLRGFVSGDKKMLVLRLFTDLSGTTQTGTTQEYDLGIVIGVKQ